MQAALAYLDLGWQPVHVKQQAKAPTMEGWTTLRPTVADLSRWFAAPANVGVALGEPSGWLVDVDLDVPEALAVAPRFLPVTWTFGRESKPRSHWLYVVPGAVTRRFADEGKVVAEIRSTAGQTVFPPSTHQDGEAIEWDADLADGTEAPRDIDAGDLQDRVVRLSMAAVLVRAGWILDDACARAQAEQPQPVRPPTPPAPRGQHHHDRLERGRRYLAKLPAAISGQGGHAATFHAAVVLVRGFSLCEEDALALLLAEYNPRCQPVWSERDMRHKVDSAVTSSTLPMGYLLDAGAKGKDARAT